MRVPAVLGTLIAVGLLPLVHGQPALAKDLFRFELAVNGETDIYRGDSFIRFFDQLTNANLGRINPSYDFLASARIFGSLRGIPVLLEYAGKGTALTFSAPALGIEANSFSGVTRDESQDLLEDFLEGNRNGILARLLAYAVAETPVDPLAGNPNSLMSLMGDQSFETGTRFGVSTLRDALDPPRGGTFDIGARYGQFSSDGYGQEVVSLPLGYAYDFGHSGFALRLAAPIRYIDTEGGETLNASLGLGLQVPLIRQTERPGPGDGFYLKGWYLTPEISGGFVGSIDLASAAGLYSGAVTSRLEFAAGDMVITVGTMLAAYRSQSVTFSDYTFDYDLENTLLKNGIAVERVMETRFLDRRLSWKAALVNARYFGDDLYIENDTQLSLSVGTVDGDAGLNNLRLEATYRFADNFDGLQLSLVYRF